ncbi:MAG: glycosyltransferase family 4 protein [Elusimicrobia bacterium]|jgi:glycosyltransferase involved in cell wall biosynthesis|nr:glycosyltransferase family 4 protein [Elusimicrobiota bacterium]MBK7208218.1 glycosyltransferase family 4 protein [Elusimicrobiota bacterium]MBK7544982.1 glycosyltransferase family 4 protein [Elusimicrobiota bacterium]MBK7574498.1 glycosyltransferase family 4 protein [Elusimicrobiota bacterium]MBK7688137.1 glycosyltransferase family 4 protein [Elusimicrobiota bacterium]
MRRIKVVHIITRLELGGAQQNTLFTAEHLDPARFEVVLLAGQGGVLAAAPQGKPYRFVRVFGLVRSVRPWSDLLALWHLWVLLRRERPDIVHTHSSKAGILGRTAAAAARVPIVIHTFHGFGFHVEQLAGVRAFYVALERAMARLSTVLVTVSRANRDEALARGIGRPGQYRLIRSGVDLSLYTSIARRRESPAGLGVLPHEKLIVTIGPFKPQKNLHDFLRAAAIVAGRAPEARFLIVGDGEGRSAIEARIETTDLTGKVVLAGWRRDIPAILARADVFCMTSLWEGLPRALVESMVAGLPCVVNAVDGCRDLIQDGVNGFLTPPKHPMATADRLLRLLADPGMAQRIGARARASVGDEFSIHTMVRQQEALYASLASDEALFASAED